MKNYIRKEFVIDSNDNLWIKFVKPDKNNYALCSPSDELLLNPIGETKLLKCTTFHKKRREQWRKNWYHEWDFCNTRYCSGKPFIELYDTNICPRHERFRGCCDDPILVFHYGRVYFASCYSVGSENFMLFNPLTLAQCGWTSHKTLQPIYNIDNLKNAK